MKLLTASALGWGWVGVPLALVVGEQMQMQQPFVFEGMGQKGGDSGIGGGGDAQHKLLGTSFGVLGVNETFDYVIIGGGTAGLTLANRLSTDPSLTIAVIEAGSLSSLDNGNISAIPAFSTFYSVPVLTPLDTIIKPQPLIDWSLITEPQPSLADRRLHYSAGKTLGGGSVRNYMLYHRPTRGTMEAWAARVGDESWGWDATWPYFKKSVAFAPPDAVKNPEGAALYRVDEAAFEPGAGPLRVSYTNWLQPMTRAVKAAFEKLGLEEIPGLNSGRLLGFGAVTETMDPRTGTRSSAETAFLGEAVSRKSGLKVYQRSLATKVLFEGRRATGVSVVTEGIEYVLEAKKEVIVSTGGWKSPQTLMLSGIGPRETLEKHGIPVLQDLPGVGQNIWDHTVAGAVYRMNVTTGSALESAPYLHAATDLFLTNQTGPLTSNFMEYIGWEKLNPAARANLTAAALADLATFPDDWPEFELFSFGIPLIPVPDDAMYGGFWHTNAAPMSRGNMTLASADPRANPVISPNYLSHPTDQLVAIAGIRRVRALAEASGITLEEIAPGPDVQTDEEILAFLRAASGPMYHVSSSCAMGKVGERMTVVDSGARVVGVEGLRVVDASIFPFLPPGHAQSVTYMLAEKIADEIGSGR